jgi:putative ABC transport system substrate-binding protein
MKKLLKGLLLTVMTTTIAVMGLAACTISNDYEEVNNIKEIIERGDIIQIGIIQMTENGSFTEMRESFIAELAELGYDETKVKVTMKNANGEISALTTAITTVTNTCDLIIPMTTTPAVQTYSYLTNNGIHKPMIFMSVTDPIASGLLTTLANPDKFCTGSSNVVPINEIFDFANSIKTVTKYGIIYDSSNTAAVSTATSAKNYLDSLSIPYVERTAKTSTEVDSAMTYLISQDIDAFYIPLDNAMQDAISIIINKTNSKKIPVYGSADVMVAKGALGTVGVSYTKIGQLTAQMVADYIGGKKTSEIPAQALEEYTMAVNLTTASTIGITIPENILSNINLIKYGTAA